jgi:hypothetical protein
MMGNRALLITFLLALPVVGQNAGNPLVGRWDFNLPGPRGGAVWLGITEKAGALDVWYQSAGGDCQEMKNFKVDGSHISIVVNPATVTRPALTLELDAAGDKITGAQKRGDTSTPLAGVRSPDLKRAAPAAWTDPEPLFNGKDLTGWEPIRNVANNHWVVKDGLLVIEGSGADLKTTRAFNDFKLHFEVKCPEGGNSGFYLRGRYESQIEYEPLADNRPEQRIGSIYGRITAKDVPRTPGQWDTFDITLVGRMVTSVHNGVTIIDHQEIEGITGGALDANEGEPGPFYLQGSERGAPGVSFRNITVSVPKP